jgi:hypothetical protein
VRVHCDEGVATHIGPESCVPARKGRGEALAGERVGQPLSRESYFNPSADAVDSAEGNMGGCVIASIRPARRGRRPWHAQKLSEREPGGPTFGRSVRGGPHREGEEP